MVDLIGRSAADTVDQTIIERVSICSLSTLFCRVMSSLSSVQRLGQLRQFINIKAMCGQSGGAYQVEGIKRGT